MTMAQWLGERIAAFRFEDLPAEALRWARIGIIDTVGVTLAGASEPCARIAHAVASPSLGDALVFGRRERMKPSDAALVNGTAAHALDFDDCSNTLGGHPSAPILPALFALAECSHASGRELVAAYVAGFEAQARLAHAVNFHHYDKGWHPTATLGVFGACAAAARLMRLDAKQTATALSIAASFASGVKANFGTMTKPLHVGHASRNGLIAAQLAREGFTAGDEAFEHRQGFFNVYNGAGHYDADAAMRSWAEPLDIVEPGIAIKQYPCCGSTHPAIDAMLMLVAEHRLTPEQVERVISRTHPRRLQHTNRPHPQSALDAKFSVQYCVARALAQGRVVLSDFEDDAYADPDIQSVMRKVTAEPDPLADQQPDHFGAEVVVELRDGRRVSKRVARAAGRTSANPLPDARIEAKFLDCASHALGRDACERALAALWQVERMADVAAFTAQIEAGLKRD
ncbi:MmgE/PrpD family protein [Paraburkholderia caribensis MBA4]|uniref:MmgE/PrpD family protein n=1 Tax=Paraburkholderia caribensis MBA4 TaxID=1323664 RepID=A0A0P0RFJ4_9BURK|nr:MmgE/PrpD family protein [Paraburkholderia caribensis]ALL67439.1 MmgE/PrpD family protein [Paraburkholderia caribensis MBA4]